MEFKNIKLKASVIHWDDKLLPALTRKEVIDRLPIVLSDSGIIQILKIPALEDGTGKVQADAVYETINEWNLENLITTCCFDTTSTNTGRKKEACKLLEDKSSEKTYCF